VQNVHVPAACANLHMQVMNIAVPAVYQMTTRKTAPGTINSVFLVLAPALVVGWLVLLFTTSGRFPVVTRQLPDRAFSEDLAIFAFDCEIGHTHGGIAFHFQNRKDSGKFAFLAHHHYIIGASHRLGAALHIVTLRLNCGLFIAFACKLLVVLGDGPAGGFTLLEHKSRRGCEIPKIHCITKCRDRIDALQIALIARFQKLSIVLVRGRQQVAVVVEHVTRGIDTRLNIIRARNFVVRDEQSRHPQEGSHVILEKADVMALVSCS